MQAKSARTTRRLNLGCLSSIIVAVCVAINMVVYPDSAKLIFMAGACGVAFVEFAWRKQLHLTWADLAFAAIITYGAASLAWSSNPLGGLQAVIIAIACLGFVVWLGHRELIHIEILCIGVMVGTWLAWISNDWLPAGAYSGFANSGYAAEALALTIPLMWFLWKQWRTWWRWLPAAHALGVVAYILAFTPSLIPHVGAGGLVVAYCVHLTWRRSRGWALLELAAWLGLGALACVVFWHFPDLRKHLAYRFEVWVNTAFMIADHPLFGGGLGSFIEDYPRYLDAHGSLMPFYNLMMNSYTAQMEAAHNEPLQVLAELGVIGFTLVAAMFFLAFRDAALSPPRRRPATTAGAALIVILIAESLLEYPTQRSASLFLAVIGFGLLRRAGALNYPAIVLSTRSFRYPKVAIAAVVGALLIDGANRQTDAEILLDEARSVSHTNPVIAINASYQAHMVDPWMRMARTDMPTHLENVTLMLGPKAIPRSIADQIFAWQDQGARFCLASMLARVNYLFDTTDGQDPGLPALLADLSRGTSRVAAVYAVKARYALLQGRYDDALKIVAQARAYEWFPQSNDIAADASVISALNAIEKAAREKMAK